MGNKGIRSPGAGVTGGCELSDVAAGDNSGPLCKSTAELPFPLKNLQLKIVILGFLLCFVFLFFVNSVSLPFCLT